MKILKIMGKAVKWWCIFLGAYATFCFGVIALWNKINPLEYKLACWKTGFALGKLFDAKEED